MSRALLLKVNVKWAHYRPGVAQGVGRGIALLLHDRGTRRGWVVSSTPRLLFTPGNDPVPILQEAGWVPGPVWTGGKSRPHRDLIPNHPARSQSLYRLSYPAHRAVLLSHVTSEFCTVTLWISNLQAEQCSSTLFMFSIPKRSRMLCHIPHVCFFF